MAPLLDWDRELYRAIHIGLHHDEWDRLLLLVTYSGDGRQAILVGIALLFNRTREAAWACLASWALSGLVRLPLAEGLKRARPSNFSWAHPLEQVFGSNSYPSGHTTTTFAIAVCLAFCTRGTRFWWVGVLALVWATLVGFSRVYVGVHYPFDVLGGAALGSGCAAVVYQFFVKKGWLPGRSDA